MKAFFAHLHPLLVHLPIGILLLAAIFAWMARSARFASLSAALPLVLRLGAAASMFACGSGWLLGDVGAYDADTLQWHQWLGIATMLMATAACFVRHHLVLSSITALLLIATGHFGATMTHGAGYLMSADPAALETKSRPEDIQEARVYSEIIAPILLEKCSSCHGPSRQKGGLRLDQPVHLQKGGKNGDVLHATHGGVGELLRRCQLAPDHEDHMPPKEKPQLEPVELELLRWWLASGADFQKKTKELSPNAAVLQALQRWQKGSISTIPAIPNVPPWEAPPADESLLNMLRGAGLVILPVSQGSHWLAIDFINQPTPPDSVFVWLEKLAPQAVWLSMHGCQASERAWQSIGQLQHLTKLSLDRSTASDTAMISLKKLAALQSINLAYTRVTANGLKELSGLSVLRNIFLYQTQITGGDWPDLQACFPYAQLDSGGYVIPFLESDTARLKAKEAY